MIAPSLALRRFLAEIGSDDPSPEAMQECLRQEPAFGERIVRYVGAYHRSETASALDPWRAHLIVGPPVTRWVAVQHAIVGGLTKGLLPARLSAILWGDLVRRAVAARALAAWVDEDGDRAFTLGLALEFGTALQLERYEARRLKWYREVRPRTGRDRLEAGARLFGERRSALLARLAREWELPEELTLTLLEVDGARGPGGAATSYGMVRVLVMADALGEALSAGRPGQVLPGWVAEATTWLGGDADDLWDLVAHVLETAVPVARVLGLRIPAQPTVEQVAHRQAGGLLGRMDALELLETASVLAEHVDALEHHVLNLEHASDASAGIDPVSGALTASEFVKALKDALRGQREPGGDPILVLADVDDLREINRRLGMATGDHTLEQVTRAMRRIVGDNPVGRLGADTFVALTYGHPRDVPLFEDRLRSGIEKHAVVRTPNGRRVRVSADVAATALSDVRPPTASAEAFLVAAEERLVRQGVVAPVDRLVTDESA